MGHSFNVNDIVGPNSYPDAKVDVRDVAMVAGGTLLTLNVVFAR